MYAFRLFCTRHSRGFELVYTTLERFLISLDPLLSGIGYNRLEKPVCVFERFTKGLMFDCHMCGQCVLSSTGMTCPMNCPKTLRNGPCGGVREDGHCEVKKEMRCVWVEAWKGAQNMRAGNARIHTVQPPVNRELEGSSSWLRVIREKAAARRNKEQLPELDRETVADVFARARRLEPGAVPIAAEPQAAMADHSVSESTFVHEKPGTKR